MHPHEIAFWLALERIGILFKDDDSLGFIIADEGSNSLKRIARQGLDNYRKNGAPFGRTEDISRVIDTIHFMDSRTSPHLQLCDLCLWIVQRYKALASSTAAQQRAGNAPTLQELYRKVMLRMTDSQTFPY